MPPGRSPKVRASRALDAANFFLADVRDGLRPYLAVYLLTVQNWDEARIGIVMSIATIAGLVTQTPAGALIDATRAKRLVMVGAAIVVTVRFPAAAALPSCCFICRTRLCCRWSDRNWRCRTGTSAPA